LESINFENVPVSRKLLVITVLSSMGVFMDGYALSIFSSAYIFLRTSFLDRGILISLAASAIYVGMFVGSLVLGRFSDSVGRRRIYVYDLLATAIFLVLTGLSSNVYQFIGFQVLAGIGIGADYPVSSSIQAEFSPRRSRGRFLVFNIFSWTIGSIAFYAISIPIVIFSGAIAWRLMYITGSIVPMIVIIARRSIPETPYWLKGQGRTEEASAVANSMAGGRTAVNVIPPEVQQGKTSFLGFGGYSKLIIFTSVAWFCYDVASYGVWNYTPSLFIQESSSYVFTMASTLMEEIPVVLGTLVCIYAIEKAGRKKLEGIGFGLAGVSLVIFGLLSYHSILPFIMIFMAFALMHFFHNIGPTNITYLYPVEIFPTRIRATGMGISAAASRIGAILGVFAFPLLVDRLSVTYGLIFFAVFEFIGLAVTLALAPETRGKSIY